MNIPIYVISLARETDRRATIKTRLDASMVNYEIVDAVDGKAEIGEWQGKIRHDIAWRVYGRKLGHGECACYFSHYRLWQRIAKMDTPAALILEDDAVWSDDFFGVIDELVNCRWQWDLVNLGGRSFVDKTATPKVKTTICQLPNNHALVQCKKTQHYAMAYLVTPAGAAKLANHAIPMRIVIDAYWNESWYHKVRHYNVLPAVAFHSEVETTLHRTTAKRSGRSFWIARSAWLNARIRTYRRRWFYLTHPRRLQDNRVKINTPNIHPRK